MSAKLLTEHHLEILSLKEGYTGLSESTLVKMSHCWKSHVTAQLYKHLVIASSGQPANVQTRQSLRSWHTQR